MQAMATEPLIGTRIRTRRQELRLTQEELARRVGVHPSTVVNWEKGKHFPTRYQGAVEAELGISLADGGSSFRPVTPQMRRMVKETLPDDPESQRRVIGLLEGTLTWPDESPAENDQRGDESRPRAV
jgi:transcriptional regulator with XRE-family HTH domain